MGVKQALELFVGESGQERIILPYNLYLVFWKCPSANRRASALKIFMEQLSKLPFDR
jgi:hypothetical protein